MVYCSKCGKQLIESAKYCYECGAKIITSETEKNTSRKVGYEREIHKCPSYGDILDSFVYICKFFGYELRRVKGCDSIKKFKESFEKIDSVDKKIDLIKTYFIPNTKEDIREFMILALSNIDPEAYNSSEEITKEIRLSDAWISKFDEAYQKAKIVFDDISEVKEFYEEYIEKKKKIEYKKREGVILKFISKNIEWLLIVGMFVIPLIFFSFSSISHRIKVFKLEALVEEVEECIGAGDYDAARLKSNQILYDSDLYSESKEKWYNIREGLLENIYENQAIAEGKICVKSTNEDFVGKNYLSVVEQLEQKGFTNIKEVKIKDLVTDWLTDNGEVEEVIIEGKTDFTETSNYSADVEIIVRYHTFKKD